MISLTGALHGLVCALRPSVCMLVHASLCLSLLSEYSALYFSFIHTVVVYKLDVVARAFNTSTQEAETL